MRLPVLISLIAATGIIESVKAGFGSSQFLVHRTRIRCGSIIHTSSGVDSSMPRGASASVRRAISTRSSSSFKQQETKSDDDSKSSRGIARRLVKLVQPQLEQLADPQKARAMQCYLKSDMPMYGIQRPGRVPIEKSMWDFFANETTTDGTRTACLKRQKELPMDLYQTVVETLWNLPRREEKYLALDVALHYEDCITMQCLPMYEQMLREDYQWWDLVDPIAVNLVGKVTYQCPTEMKPILKRWIRDDNMWIRRTAILAQLKFKDRMDEELLFQFCRNRMHEKEFFIRKAIGWVLREYSKTAPDAVRTFLSTEKANLSGLSYREGSRILIKRGLMH